VLSQNARRVYLSEAEARGFSPAADRRSHAGASSPEATRLQGLRARSALGPLAARLEPRPSVAAKNLPSMNNVCVTLRNCGKQLRSGGGKVLI